MKAIIIGGGSIGQRHAGNLKSLGVDTRIVDIDEIETIDSILNDGFDFGLVCSPNLYHIEHCTKLAEYNIPTFCEKPFYSDVDGVASLLKTVEEKKLITMVAANLRFAEEVKSIDSTASYINVHFGYDLKKWRPDSDHLLSYSANKALGGGILLDAIHELDYLYFKFGKIQDIFYNKSKLTNITNDTEDLVVGRIYFESGTIADFSLNYLAEDYQRYYEILEDGVLKRRNINISNQMYIDEMTYFVDCVKSNVPAMNDFAEANGLLAKILN